ncbi:WD repeat-containing protein 13 [Auxenochlorella protothecoides]|uniref:WD repeat-containing protein 13 n=1 Tax=Auxenochlorella protothecoides TaxID=3075 RepID=A0A087SG69_AUXPR|nr:WD repeat-containing protein 13 [Auxenochlorella protothecoides]KFM24723.1 WD repeat-containing protein 13 [Auxenochlorella protothecoides]
MPNVGLQAYLWNRLPEDARVKRLLWQQNAGTYKGYRAYIQHVKGAGFPEVGAEEVLRAHSTGEWTAQQEDPSSPRPAPSSPTTTPLPTPRIDFHHAFSAARSPVSQLRFGRLTRDLLAWGDDAGAVFVAALGASPRVLLALRGGHAAPVTDLDWSGDNGLLASCSADGSACLWEAGTGALLRRFPPGVAGDAPLLSLRLHPVNQNLVLVGTGAGEVLVLNASTGQCTARAPPAAPGAAAARLEVATDVVHVAASDGTLSALSTLLPGSTGALRLGLHAELARDGQLSLHPLPERGHALGAAQRFRLPRGPYAPRAALGGGGFRAGRGTLCALGRADATVHVHVLEAGGATKQARGVGEPACMLRGHAAAVAAAAWAFDESCLASADVGGDVLVWHVQA